MFFCLWNLISFCFFTESTFKTDDFRRVCLCQINLKIQLGSYGFLSFKASHNLLSACIRLQVFLYPPLAYYWDTNTNVGWLIMNYFTAWSEVNTICQLIQRFFHFATNKICISVTATAPANPFHWAFFYFTFTWGVYHNHRWEYSTPGQSFHLPYHTLFHVGCQYP